MHVECSSGNKEIRDKIDLAIKDYKSNHLGRPPTIAVLNEAVYNLLEKSGLLRSPKSFGDIFNRDELMNTHDLCITVYKTNELTTRKRSELESAASCAKSPFILGRRGLFRTIKNEVIYNLHSSVTELSYL